MTTFEISTVASVPAEATSSTNAHAFPWGAMVETAKSNGAVARISIPEAYWVERGASKEDLKPAALRQRIRNHFNTWAKADETRKGVTLELATVDGAIDAYVRVVA